MVTTEPETEPERETEARETSRRAGGENEEEWKKRRPTGEKETGTDCGKKKWEATGKNGMIAI